MKPRLPNFVVEKDDPAEPLVIRDIGPFDRFPKVTNSAEEVVEELVRVGYLDPGRRLLYYDSDGQLDEILIRDGRFAGFSRPTEEIEKEV